MPSATGAYEEPAAPPAAQQPGGPSASTVLRRALFIWGSGHLALGERIGWLLLVLQPLCIIGLAFLVVLFVEGSRWIAVFPGLALLIGLWVGQAMHAHRLATDRGFPAGGEFQVALLLPLVVALLSGFWMVGGGLATPAATVQHYVAAWQADRPEEAERLFVDPVDAGALAAEWRAQRDYLEAAVERAAARYGSGAGLDPRRVFNSLRFEQATAAVGVDRAVVAVDLVRQQRIEASLFGLIPTATQQTVVIEQFGLVVLRAEPAPMPDWLPLGENPSRVWLIERIELPGGPG